MSINFHFKERERIVKEIIERMDKMIKEEKQFINQIIELTKENIEDPIDKLIKKESSIIEEFKSQIIENLIDHDINDTQLVKKRINEIIEAEKIDESENKEYLA